MEVQAYDSASSVDNSVRGLNGLRQAPSHPDVPHAEAWQAASIVHVRMPEELLADALADILLAKSRPWIRHSVFGLHDEEHCLGSARRQCGTHGGGHGDDIPRVARLVPILRASKL